ncbi:hypothetical protein PENSPDRAFT_655152 [Peniophora sp. CONT]|nr:hypothetical protein PENSPDRAFT_655152 [Peniophora sp. CONT]
MEPNDKHLESIATLVKRQWVLRARRDPNEGHSPIFVLPNELLSDIFRLFGEAYDEKRSCSAITLRSVCQRWKNVAESTPELWTGMLMQYGIEWTRRAVKWSKDLSLDLRIRQDSQATMVKRSDEWKQSATLTLAEMERLRSLDLSPYLLGTEVVENLLSARPAPRLESLIIVGPSNIARALNLRNNLFHGSSPQRLRTVSFSYVTVSPKCPIFRSHSMTSLNLWQCNVWTTIDHVLDSLVSMPKLESFNWCNESSPEEIERRSLPPMPPKKRKGKPATLHRLRTFAIRQQAQIVLGVFSQIVIPPSCEIELDFHLDFATSRADLSALLSGLDIAIGTHFAKLFPSKNVNHGYTVLLLGPFWLSDPHERGFSVTWATPTTKDIGELALGFCPPDSSTDYPLVDILTYMLSRWSHARSAITRVEIDQPEIFEEGGTPADSRTIATRWTQAFSHLNALETLAATIDAGPRVPEFLMVDTTILPHLSQVYFVESDLPKDALATLAEAFSRRCEEHNRPPVTIAFEGCMVGGVQMTQMCLLLGKKVAHLMRTPTMQGFIGRAGQ